MKAQVESEVLLTYSELTWGVGLSFKPRHWVVCLRARMHMCENFVGRAGGKDEKPLCCSPPLHFPSE